MKKIIDISWPITPDMTTYKDKQPISFEHLVKFDGSKARLSAVHCSSHTGTHIDAPAHFIKDGNTIEYTKLEQLVGSCRVLDLTHVQEKITADDLQQQTINAGEIILFKTKNSNHAPTDPFDFNFVYLDTTGAQYLVEKNIKAVGIDYLGIERDDSEHPIHITLMQKNIPIIEGLRLGHVDAGFYTLYCLPLRIEGLEAALARAILVW